MPISIGIPCTCCSGRFCGFCTPGTCCSGSCCMPEALGRLGIMKLTPGSWKPTFCGTTGMEEYWL